MDEAGVTLAVSIARRLPSADVRALAAAAEAGVPALLHLRGQVASPALRDAADDLISVCASGDGGDALAGALLAATAMHQCVRAETHLDVVWTGPSSDVRTHRLTAAVVTGLIAQAQRELLLVGFAVHTELSIAEALTVASDHGVDITLLLERPADNPRYTGPALPFADVRARRLAWPADRRPEGGAALHAKVLVADRQVALVGSANITGWALTRNLECGLLVRDSRTAESIHRHIEGLVLAGALSKG